MTEKPIFVDLIAEATRQNRRRVVVREPEPPKLEKPRVGRWPPPRWAEWRLSLRKPWKND